MGGIHWPKGWFTSQPPGGSRFHHGTQNGAQFKTYALFTSGFFHLIILDCGCPWVTETSERETTIREDCCVASVVSDSVRPHRRQPTRLCRPWDSPGKNTGRLRYFYFEICNTLASVRASMMAQMVKNLPAMRKTWVRKIPGEGNDYSFQ